MCKLNFLFPHYFYLFAHLMYAKKEAAVNYQYIKEDSCQPLNEAYRYMPGIIPDICAASLNFYQPMPLI